MAIVAPPYGIGIVTEFQKATKQSGGMMSKLNGIWGSEWDSATPNKEYFQELNRVSKNQIIWGGNYFIDHLSSSRCFIIWDKMNGNNALADAELAWSSFDKSVRIFRMHHFSHGYGTKIHPTQKPVKLYEWLLMNYAKPGDRILDTHLGSGSSAIAAHYGEFDFVGCELDKDYYEAACERFTQATAQQALI